MSSIRKSLLQIMFLGASMRRWNDKLRPIELYEVDKQGHKMIIAWMLTLLNSRHASESEKIALQQTVIERGLFDYLFGLIVTDITPQIFHRICEHHIHKKQLTDWVLNKLKPIVEPLSRDFWERMVKYHSQTDRTELADKIIKAARLYASGWEFALIQPFNTFDEETKNISHFFISELSALKELTGVQELIQGEAFFIENPTALGHFARLSGQLRFQIRWSDTPRVPETSVLGHMFLVAGYAYFCSLVIGCCPARCVNNFFAGLFHDLPELLTRDIITPVKRSVDQFSILLKEYELQELERRIFVPLRKSGYIDLVHRLQYYLGLLGEDVTSEFQETIQDSSGVKRIKNFEELQSLKNKDEFDPKDGQLLKACDSLAAFLEAHTSIYKGISSPVLHAAVARIHADFHNLTFGTLSFGTLLADFD